MYMSRFPKVVLVVVIFLILLGRPIGAQGPASKNTDTTQVALGTAFTYQGHLTQNGTSVNGMCDSRFRLFDSATAGDQVGPTQTFNNVSVTNGLFTVQLDFGDGAFDGEKRWLAVEVRCPAGSGSFMALSPRQELTPTPYALFAADGGAAGGDGFWSLTGNAGTDPATHFLGTTDDQPLVLKTNGTEQMRITQSGVIVQSSDRQFGMLITGGSNDGIDIGPVDEDGVDITTAGTAGTGGDGIHIGSAGSPSTTSASAVSNGFEVEGAEGHGMFVGHADEDGVRVNSANVAGINVRSADVVGVRGRSSTGIGVNGISSSGVGILGEALAADGDTEGVLARVNSPAGEGLQAENNSDNSNANIIAGCSASNCTEVEFLVKRNGDVLADGSFTGPADFAEMMSVVGEKEQYAPGDVLVIGPQGQLTQATAPYATNLAGVYSTKPGFVGDTEITEKGVEVYERGEAGQTRIPVALMGIVPVKVTTENGAIQPGDLLTTSNTPGHAMKASPVVINDIELYLPGAILGKALERLEKGTGVIEVLVTLR